MAVERLAPRPSAAGGSRPRRARAPGAGRPARSRTARPAAPPSAAERRAPDPRRLPGFDHLRLGALGLSRRELAVLELVAEGRRNEQIAAALRISPLTVKKHLELMYGRLGATNRASLVALAWQASQRRRAPMARSGRR